MSRLLTTLEAAERLSISRRTVQEMIARRELPRIHVGRSVRVPSDDLDRWIASHTEQPIRDGEDGSGPDPVMLKHYAG